MAKEDLLHARVLLLDALVGIGEAQVGGARAPLARSVPAGEGRLQHREVRSAPRARGLLRQRGNVDRSEVRAMRRGEIGRAFQSRLELGAAVGVKEYVLERHGSREADDGLYEAQVMIPQAFSPAH